MSEVKTEEVQEVQKPKRERVVAKRVTGVWITNGFKYVVISHGNVRKRLPVLDSKVEDTYTFNMDDFKSLTDA